MAKQNITLSLPKEILKKGKLLAAKKGVSLNQLVRELLQQSADHEEGYRTSADRQTKQMKEGIPLGTKGRIAWKRAELYQR